MMRAVSLLVRSVLYQSDAGEAEDVITSVLSLTDLSAWDQWVAEHLPMASFVPSDFLSQMASAGSIPWTEQDIHGLIARLLMPELPAFGRNLLLYIGFGVAASILHALNNDRNHALPEGVLHMLGGCLVLTTTLPLLKDTAAMLRAVSQTAQIMLPGILSFLAAFDFSSSGAAVSEGIATVCGGVISAATGIILPLTLMGGVLYAMDGFGHDRLYPLGNACLRIGRWLLRGGTGLYLAVQGIKSAVAVHGDSLLYRSAKLAAGGLPYIGGLASGSFDTVLYGMLYIRSLLGVTGVCVVSIFMLRPALRILLSFLSVRMASICVLPLGIDGYGRILNGMGEMLRLVLSLHITVWIMLFAVFGLALGIWQM